MKLSIIVPVYNVEKYIQRCIESIMTQIIDRFRVECLLIDDCSPDSSMTIAKELIENYQGSIHFICYRHEKNKGLSEARNTGIRNATGDFVLFIDSDDYLMPNALLFFLEAKEKYPEADIVIGNVFEYKYKKNQYDIKDIQFINEGTMVRRWMLTNEFAISAWNKIFHRQFLIDNKLFFEPGILHEDIPWTYQLYTKISSILLLPNVTYGYWYNELSISNSSQTSDKTVRSFVSGCQILLDIPYEKELFVPQYLFIFRWLLNAINTRKNCSSKDLLKTLYSQRSRLMISTLSNYRFILAVYFLLMYRPFNDLLRFRCFRRYYNNYNSIVRKIAELFNFLHT